MKTTTYDQLTKEQQMLVDEAEKAMQESYNPYSNFFVGSAILTDDGKVITGTNVENASYGAAICSERSAIMRANIMGHRMFKSIAIITKGKDFDTKEPSASCGICRQVIFEFSQIAGHDIDIILSTTKKNKIVITSIRELLPMAFGPYDLELDVTRFKK